MGNLIDQNPNMRAITSVVGGPSPIKPGTFVNFDGAAFMPASDMSKKLFVLGANDFAGQDAETETAVGASAIGYVVGPNDLMSVRISAGTYAYGDQLTMGTAGTLKKAASGDHVVAFYEDADGVAAAGDRKNISIATYAAAVTGP